MTCSRGRATSSGRTHWCVGPPSLTSAYLDDPCRQLALVVQTFKVVRPVPSPISKLSGSIPFCSSISSRPSSKDQCLRMPARLLAATTLLAAFLPITAPSSNPIAIQTSCTSSSRRQRRACRRKFLALDPSLTTLSLPVTETTLLEPPSTRTPCTTPSTPAHARRRLNTRRFTPALTRLGLTRTTDGATQTTTCETSSTPRSRLHTTLTRPSRTTSRSFSRSVLHLQAASKEVGERRRWSVDWTCVTRKRTVTPRLSEGANHLFFASFGLALRAHTAQVALRPPHLHHSAQL